MKKIGPDLEIVLWYKLGQLLWLVLPFALAGCVLLLLGG